MSSTKNIKGNRKVVHVVYYAPWHFFKIPDGLDLEDKTVVEYWDVNWGKLYIKYVGKSDIQEIEAEYEAEVDYKNPQDVEIEDADDYNIEYNGDDEDEEEE